MPWNETAIPLGRVSKEKLRNVKQESSCRRTICMALHKMTTTNPV